MNYAYNMEGDKDFEFFPTRLKVGEFQRLRRLFTNWQRNRNYIAYKNYRAEGALDLSRAGDFTHWADRLLHILWRREYCRGSL